MDKTLCIIRLCRPHQYVKNGFVFIGVLFGHEWSGIMLGQALLVFLAFCCCASAVYIFNDIQDVENDRAHPRKCKRPIASGLVSIKLAVVVCAGLCVLASIFALSVHWRVFCIIFLYVAMNVCYSAGLKQIVLLDVFIIASGFMLRILAGTVGLFIAPSEWLLLCGLMLTLFLGFCKRRSELAVAINAEQSFSRPVLKEYSLGLLDQLTAIAAACTIVSYGLYTVSVQTIAIHGSTHLIYTLPPVIYAMFRYLYLVHTRGRGEDTARDLLADKHLIISVVIWFVLTFSILQVGN